MLAMRRVFSSSPLALLLALGLPGAAAAQGTHELAKLSAFSLGFGVAINGDTAVAGVFWALNRRAAYVFVRNGSGWTEQAMLVGHDTVDWDDFGTAVAISADTIVIGAPRAGYTGAAYVFVRNGSGWVEQAKLAGAAPNDRFGARIALDGDTALIDAYGADYRRRQRWPSGRRPCSSCA